jgi:magnesium transporter
LDKFLEAEKINKNSEPWCKLNKTVKVKKLSEYVERVNKLIKENFNIDLLMVEIKSKTEELDKYLTGENERRTNNLLSLLTIISAVLAPITIITGIFGMNFTFNEVLHPNWQSFLFKPVWFYWCIIGWVMICLPLVIYFLRKRRR